MRRLWYYLQLLRYGAPPVRTFRYCRATHRVGRNDTMPASERAAFLAGRTPPGWLDATGMTPQEVRALLDLKRRVEESEERYR